MNHSEAGYLMENSEANAGAASGFALTGDRLFDSILYFNLFPGAYVHAERLNMISPLLSETGCGTANVANAANAAADAYWLRHLSDLLLRMHQLDQAYDFDFTDKAKRLAFLDAQTLLLLGGKVASIMLQPRLRKIVDGAQIKKIDEVMGSGCRKFGLRWEPAPHLKQMQPLTHLQGMAEAAADSLAAAYEWQDFAFRAVLSVLPACATGVRGRLLLKFPTRFSRIKAYALSDERRMMLAALFSDVLEQAFPASYARIEVDLRANGHA
jgi:hypothetical protein